MAWRELERGSANKVALRLGSNRLVKGEGRWIALLALVVLPYLYPDMTRNQEALT